MKKTHFNYAKDAINKLIEKNIKFDGIFAINDWLALGALYALKDNNFKIPDEVKIVGFDNVSISKYSYPNITTVNQNKKLMGRTAAKTLLDLINNKQTKNKIHTKLPIDIVYRSTT